MTHDSSAPHLGPDELEAWLAGVRAPALLRHVEECSACFELVRAEEALVVDLDALPLHAPGPDFADRVMASVRVPDPFAIRAIQAALPAMEPSRTTARQAAIATDRREANRRRRAAWIARMAKGSGTRTEAITRSAKSGRGLWSESAPSSTTSASSALTSSRQAEHSSTWRTSAGARTPASQASSSSGPRCGVEESGVIIVEPFTIGTKVRFH